jgi:hypothetical protein
MEQSEKNSSPPSTPPKPHLLTCEKIFGKTGKTIAYRRRIWYTLIVKIVTSAGMPTRAARASGKREKKSKGVTQI